MVTVGWLISDICILGMHRVSRWSLNLLHVATFYSFYQPIFFPVLKQTKPDLSKFECRAMRDEFVSGIDFNA